jgi:phage terminase large subunit-like protein
LTAVTLCFPVDDKFFLMPFIFCPEDNIKIRAKKDKVPYELWEKEGYLISTPGNVTDYQYIISKLVELQKLFNIEKIAVDRWNSTFLITKLQEEGFNVETFGQGFSSMTGPTRAFERLTLNGSLFHTGHPILRWAVGNVMLKVDPSGNQKPDKEGSTERIDPVIASIMSLALAGAAESIGSYNISWSQ